MNPETRKERFEKELRRKKLIVAIKGAERHKKELEIRMIGLSIIEAKNEIKLIEHELKEME